MHAVYPLIGSETTKSVIMGALSEEWPLSAKKLYFKVKGKNRKAITYQAVYKSVKELLAEGVLSRQDVGYMISPLWVEKAGAFINGLLEVYEKSSLSNARKLQELNFTSWSDVWNFLVSKINTNFFGESTEAFVQLRRFFLVPISEGDIRQLKEFFSRKKVFIMCRGNSLVDKTAARFLRSLGANVITGIECARPTTTLVYGNCVVSVYTLGEKNRANLTKYYGEIKDMKLSDMGVFKTFGNVLKRKLKVKLVINRDPDVLSDVLEQTRVILSKRTC